ncbi:NF-X1 type zinc finger, partial [Ostertagia ostertagi]
LRKNIPCHIEAVSCGRVCDKPLSCGVHNCNRNCHAGDCMKEGEKCTRPCMVLRRPCEHPCSLPCHGAEPCPESECRHPVNVTCECGKRRSTLKCSEPTFLGPSLNHNFRPMSVDKRRFIHEYAAFFSIETAGVDDPPKRSVIATARRGVSRAPLVLLTSLQKYPNMLKVAGSVTLKSCATILEEQD